MIDERRGTGGWDSVLGTEAHLVAPGGEWRSELHAIAVEQFDAAADVLDLDPELRARLREPRRSLVANDSEDAAGRGALGPVALTATGATPRGAGRTTRWGATPTWQAGRFPTEHASPKSRL